MKILQGRNGSSVAMDGGGREHWAEMGITSVGKGVNSAHMQVSVPHRGPATVKNVT